MKTRSHSPSSLRDLPVRGRRPAGSGFTIIELLLAILFSLILILMTFTAFRSITKTIGDLHRMTDENRLIRSGYFLVSEDADRWRSHADPAFPYLRRHQGINEERNSLYDVRPFRPVTWPSDLDEAACPNWNQPHDPRSWYRGFLLPNVETGRLAYLPKRNEHGPYVERLSDFAVQQDEQEMREQWGRTGYTVQTPFYEWVQDREVLPEGWNTWHAVGDWASLSHIDMDTAGDGREPGARPKQVWHIFQELGTRGLATYLPAGSQQLIVAPSRNETVENYRDPVTRADTHFMKGEIPWSLHGSGNLLWSKEMDVLEGARPDGDLISYPADFADHLLYPSRDPEDYNRQNYAHAMPTSFDVAHSNTMGGRALPLLTDFTYHTGEAASLRGLPIERRSYQAIYSLVYPANPMRTHISRDELDWTRYLRETAYPLEAWRVQTTAWEGDVAQIKFTNPTTGHKIGEFAIYNDQLRQQFNARHTRHTWRLPRNYTDSPEPALDAAGMAMATNIRRHLSNGIDKADCQVILHNPETEAVKSINFRLLTTDFRGARQYWGRRTAGGLDDGLGNEVELGDRYE